MSAAAAAAEAPPLPPEVVSHIVSLSDDPFDTARRLAPVSNSMRDGICAINWTSLFVFRFRVPPLGPMSVREEWAHMNRLLELLPSEPNEASILSAIQQRDRLQLRNLIAQGANLASMGQVPHSLMGLDLPSGIPPRAIHEMVFSSTLPGLLDPKEMALHPIVTQPTRNALDMVDFLVEKGADPLLLDAKGRTALHVAAKESNRLAHVANLVRLAPEAALTTDNKGRTPLHYLLRAERQTREDMSGTVVVFAALIWAGDSGESEDQEGVTPAQLLKEHLPDLEPFFPLLHFNTFEIRNAVLTQLAFVNPLLLRPCTRLFADDIHHMYKDTTLLHLTQNPNSVQVFLDAGMNACYLDGSGRTAAHIYAERGDADALEVLCKHDPSVLNIPDQNGQTPLHRLSQGDVQLLLRDWERLVRTAETIFKHPVDVNACDAQDKTPLLLAIETSCSAAAESTEEIEVNADLIDLLLTHDADPNKGNPLQIVQTHRQAQLERELLAHGAQQEAPDVSEPAAKMARSK